jgi:hypothetical protein
VNGSQATRAAAFHPAKLIDEEISRGLRAVCGQRRGRCLGQFRSAIDDPNTAVLTAVTGQRVQRYALWCLEPEVQRQTGGFRI